jgi:hypothetical protein
MVTDEELLAARKPSWELPPWTQDPATSPQLGYIKGLVESRDIPESWLLKIKELMEAEGGLKKGDAGNIIKSLKERPLKPDADNRSINKPTIDDVPPGRYAVQTGQAANDLSYYRIKEVGQDNKYRIILQIAGPSEHLLKGQAAKDAIKRIVRFGLGDAAVLYGRTIGRCSQCHIRITNRLSRELGIGPICGGRVYGEGWERRVNSARSALQARGLDPAENVEL